MSEMEKTKFSFLRLFHRMGLGLVALFWLAGAAHAAAQIKQEVFPTPESAVDALVAANRNNDTKALLKVLGPASEKLIHSGDSVADREGRKKFVEAYDAVHKIESEGDNRRILIVGAEEWPMPIPLVRSDRGWRFDSAEGELEILNRRIGRNELNVIRVCRAYVEAQREHAAQNRKDGKPPVYAQKLLSAPGKQDGLYWPATEGAAESPLGPLIADAAAEGYSGDAALAQKPYHGYFYKILTQQGEHAAGGARDYIADGRMTRGFALIAFPAKYGDSGVMSFIVNQNGIVYEKNLGPDGAEIARRMEAFDPDESWKMP
jgi:hypothetical protein